MARWTDIEAVEPEWSARVRSLLTARRHLTLATLRSCGAPRLGGIEAVFSGGDVLVGMMWMSRKARDLRRDPRFALHSQSVDPPDWEGDAVLSGVAHEILDPAEVAAHLASAGHPEAGPAHLFRLDLHEVSLVREGVPADHLVIDVWTPARGRRTMRRS